MIIDDELTIDEYCKILQAANWLLPSKRLLEKSLKNSMTAKYVLENETIGMARLVTDHGCIGLITDVVVMPKYQRQGYGKKLIERLIERIKDSLEDGEEYMIQLLSVNGKKEFYKKIGFQEKPQIFDAGMYIRIKK